MTELDLGLKVGVRRLFWSMGLSTRLDVELRGFTAPTGHGAGRSPESFTDLDVLALAVSGSYRLSAEIADCKTSRRDSTSRMFWVRGVADFFGADHAYLVREHDVTDAARQLSARLGITVLPSGDLARLQDHHGSQALLATGTELDLLFDRKAVAAHLAAFNGLSKQLKSLLDYRQFDYWVYEEHRNPVQLVAHLIGARPHLDPRNPIHVALFLDMSWLYLVSLIRVTGHIRGAFLGDPDRGLQDYMFGGATNLREKQEAAELLRSVSPPGSGELNHLPVYYSLLREVVTRLLRRPDRMQAALRHGELAVALASARQRIALPQVLGSDFDPVAAKLLADVCGFLVAAAQLDTGFRTRARAYLLSETAQFDNAPGAETTVSLTPTPGPTGSSASPTTLSSADPNGAPPHDPR